MPLALTRGRGYDHDGEPPCSMDGWLYPTYLPLQRGGKRRPFFPSPVGQVRDASPDSLAVRREWNRSDYALLIRPARSSLLLSSSTLVPDVSNRGSNRGSSQGKDPVSLSFFPGIHRRCICRKSLPSTPIGSRIRCLFLFPSPLLVLRDVLYNLYILLICLYFFQYFIFLNFVTFMANFKLIKLFNIHHIF